MREIVGPAATPEVEVCFSQKYSGQVDRINKNWLPIYTKEFPTARPLFLTDETDPGAATKYGTAAFVSCLRDGVEAASGDFYRPEQETPAGWADYVRGLLNGVRSNAPYAASIASRSPHILVPCVDPRCACVSNCPELCPRSEQQRCQAVCLPRLGAYASFSPPLLSPPPPPPR